MIKLITNNELAALLNVTASCINKRRQRDPIWPVPTWPLVPVYVKRALHWRLTEVDAALKDGLL